MLKYRDYIKTSLPWQNALSKYLQMATRLIGLNYIIIRINN